MNYPKFLNNKRETFTFKFDTGLEKEGKFGPQWSFGVKWKHEDGTEEETYLYATEALNRLLERLNPLKNRTIQIELAQDPKDLKRKYWVIYDENGAEITPKVGGQSSSPVQPENASSAIPEDNNDEIAAINERLDKASKAFIALREELFDRMKSLETLVSTVTSENAVALHTSLPNRDIRETKEIVKDAAAIVNSYKSDPTIPTINELPKDFDNSTK